MDVMKWRDAEIGKMLENVLEGNGVKPFSWGWIMGGIGGKKKMVRLPSDAKGLKLRRDSKTDEEMLRAAGAAITSMPSRELFFAL